MGNQMSALSAYASKPVKEIESVSTGQGLHAIDTKARITELFDAPTHILPSIESLAPTFLELLTCNNVW